jgi:DNA invertase Pin-like site-specific DNA recombinase
MSGCDAVDGSSTGTRVPSKQALLGRPMIRRSQTMQTVTTIGLDIAKSVFQVHGVDADGNVVVRRQLKRRCVLAFFQKLPSCLVGIEACASSHYWSRELQALGHTVRLMPPAYVKPYVKRQKNDAADAEAICEAVTRPRGRAPRLGFAPLGGSQPELRNPILCGPDPKFLASTPATLAVYMKSCSALPSVRSGRANARRPTSRAQSRRAERIYSEKISGAVTDRKALAKALAALEPGDVLRVKRLDRLARSTRDLLNTLDAIGKKGSLADTWADTTTPRGRLMVTILTGLAEFERALILAHTSEGRTRAMARRVRFGRKPKLSRFQIAEAVRRREAGENSLPAGRLVPVKQLCWRGRDRVRRSLPCPPQGCAGRCRS